MKARHPALRLLLATALLASAAAAGQTDTAVRIEAATAPAGTDQTIKTALRTSVRQQILDAHLDEALEGYSLSPSLVQLRRYVGPAPARAKLVCIVALALKNEHGVVADVRGNGATSGASALEAIDAAAHAAVSRLPAALAHASGGAGNAAVAQR